MLMLHADAEDIRDVDAGAETGAAAFDAEINADAELALLKYDADTGADQAYDANCEANACVGAVPYHHNHRRHPHHHQERRRKLKDGEFSFFS